MRTCRLPDVPSPPYSTFHSFAIYLLKIIQVLSDLLKMPLISTTLICLNNLKVVLSLVFVCNIRLNQRVSPAILLEESVH